VQARKLRNQPATSPLTTSLVYGVLDIELWGSTPGPGPVSPDKEQPALRGTPVRAGEVHTQMECPRRGPWARQAPSVFGAGRGQDCLSPKAFVSVGEGSGNTNKFLESSGMSLAPGTQLASVGSLRVLR